ncbi:MAG: helix-turn-helix transcriptional regulator [Acaryochloridaceae cyanobacterium CSU_3_4]|nr:helix-turn-helix transcriptional regulator [Acaryochloridaceae cyanobacterium CSU_3_4]
MPFILTPDTFDSLWAESDKTGQASCPDTDTDIIDQAILPHIGRFWSCHTPLQPGLDLVIQEWEVPSDLLRTGDVEEPSQTVGLAFYLSGKVQTQLHGLTGEIEEIVGHFDFCSCSEFVETELWQAGQPFRRIYLGIESLTLWGNLSPQDFDLLPIELQRTLAGNHHPYLRYRAMTPAMHQALQQILYCPYGGLLKRMYLQGKAWELMAIAFEQLRPATHPLEVLMPPQEIERIHHAKEILIRQLQNPPSLIELAQQANLNVFALKQGFKQVFGTTAFQYLCDHRLEVARQLLVTQPLRIADIAQQVGFANRGYFAAVFKKKFGLTPKQYRQRQKTP